MTLMITPFRILGMSVVGCAMGLMLTSGALALSDEDFNALKDRVTQVEKTQAIGTNAATKAEAAVVQPVHPVPALGPNATHNFTMVGDAEVQFGKTEGQHG